MDGERKPGEKSFSYLLLLIGLFALVESLKMYSKDPTSSSFGAIPLFLSCIIVLFQAKIIFFELRRAPKAEDQTEGGFVHAIRQILPKDIVVVFLALLVYCLMLVFKAGFEVATILFLLFTMTYLMRGQLIKNIIYTALSMAFILIVFRTLFQVILP